MQLVQCAVFIQNKKKNQSTVRTLLLHTAPSRERGREMEGRRTYLPLNTHGGPCRYPAAGLSSMDVASYAR
jgi:hypothetical protein